MVEAINGGRRSREHCMMNPGWAGLTVDTPLLPATTCATCFIPVLCCCRANVLPGLHFLSYFYSFWNLELQSENKTGCKAFQFPFHSICKMDNEARNYTNMCRPVIQEKRSGYKSVPQQFNNTYLGQPPPLTFPTLQAPLESHCPQQAHCGYSL